MDQDTDSTILLVEDVEEIASHIERELNRRAHNVLRAVNANEAIQIARKASPAMILTDRDLPTLTNLLDLLTEQDHLKEIPVAIIDIDELDLNDPRIKVLPDFAAVDDLMDSVRLRNS